jgi:DNA-binding NarL/FixJ family response regulator
MRIVLADDHRILREGLRAVLEKNHFEVVGEASTGLEAIAVAHEQKPDVVIMDINMPDLNGIDATRRLTMELPGVKVLALSMHSDQRYVIAMFEAGAAGYVLKNASTDELLLALPAVVRGQIYVSPALAGVVANRALGRRRPSDAKAKALNPLTPREREVLQLLAEGKSSKEIAVTLAIALPTVETHRRQLMGKLGMRTIAELTKYAIREGLTSVES